MKKRFEVPLVVFLAACAPVLAQHPVEGGHEQAARPPQVRPANPPRANQGKIPPPPPQREAHAKPEPEKRENGKINTSQHVNNDHWYGHDAPNDKRYHIDHPYEHGHFEHFGPSYRYNVVRIDKDHHRFWFPGGFYFEVAPWDWFICADWCWDCGDDFVVYEDTDHPGWYLLYNVHTGVYVHVNYLGT
jgi:hypothetical protein